MARSRRLALVLLLVPFALSCRSHAAAVAPRPSAEVSGALLPSEALRADLATLERVYRSLHPGLHRYLDEAALVALFATARAELSRDRSLGDAFLVLTRLTAGLRCGHSYPNFSNQSEAVAAALFRGRRLPFWFRWIDDRMVVTRDFSGAGLVPPGTTVESVGGVPSRALLQAMLPLARADGSNDAKRRAYLEVVGDSELEAFDIFLPLLFPAMTSAPDLALDLRLPDGRRRVARVALQSFASRARAARAQRSSEDENAPLWHLDLRQQAGTTVAYLPMATWVTYHTRWDWKAFIHETMATLATRQTPLVIDLRGNEGGADVGDEILAHMIDAPMPSRTMVRRVRFRTVPDDLRPILDTWDRSFFELGVGATDRGNGWFELASDESTELAPRAPRYRGKVVVLVDGSNSSATFQFAGRVQTARLGILVGTPTGGNQRGINGGAFFFARLPRTGLEVDVPLIGTFPAEPDDVPDRGVTPDVLVPPSVADIASGTDRALATALELAVH